MLGASPGQRVGEFVTFVDFGPTVLRLAGVDVPPAMDGRPFLGPKITTEGSSARDEAYGYADRCSLRKGRYKYIRNYQAFYPDALQNNYRYQMLAYSQWRDLARQGDLNAVQSQFFQPKAVEALYDLEADPHEVHNLAGEAGHAETLLDLRGRLQRWVKGLPDLSFYPESFLVAEALPDGAAYGKAHADEIARLVDTADLALLPWGEAAPRLKAAQASKNRWERYWALVAASCFGRRAASLAPEAEALGDDPELLVRVRAAEFLALSADQDPRPALYNALSGARSPLESLLTLNTVVFLRDRRPSFDFDVTQLKTSAVSDEVDRRLAYLRGDTIAQPKAKKQPRAKRLSGQAAP
jgi:uncharacterized sulfatase